VRNYSALVEDEETDSAVTFGVGVATRIVAGRKRGMDASAVEEGAEIGTKMRVVEESREGSLLFLGYNTDSFDMARHTRTLPRFLWLVKRHTDQLNIR